MTMRLLSFTIIATAFSAHGEAFTNLPITTSGYQLVEKRVVIYKDSKHEFVWGIILREREGGGSYHSSPFQTKATLRDGVSLALITNELKIVSHGITNTHKMEPYTIYLLEEDLSVQECKNLSGIEFVPRQVQSGGHSHEPPIGTYVTVYDLKLPIDIYTRFKPSK